MKARLPERSRLSTPLNHVPVTFRMLFLIFGLACGAKAADWYWSGGSNFSNLIDQDDNWWGFGNPSSGDNLYFDNTTNRHTAYSNYGSGSWFGNIVTYNGAGGIKWEGNQTWAYKFENHNDPVLFEIASDIGNRTGSDLELNPVGSGGITVTGKVTITEGKAIRIYGDQTLTLNGSVEGNGASLNLVNNATVLMNQSNTYTGGTNVDAGTLVVNGSLSSTGSVSVAAGAVLKGTGTVGGPTIIAGIHAPGGSVGTQKFGGSLTYSANSIFEWELNPASTTDPGVVADAATGTYDKVEATGVVTGSSVFRVILGSGSFTDEFWNSHKGWTNLFTMGGGSSTLADIFTAFGGSGVGTDGVVSGQGQFSFSGNTLSWTAVPEPTAALAGILLGAGLWRRRR